MSKDALRQRIRRNSIRSDKGEDGRVYVYVDASTNAVQPTPSPEAGHDELVRTLRDEVAHLRRESERKDEIIMSLSLANAEQARTIRAIEAPQEPSEAPETAADTTPRGDVPDDHSEAQEAKASRMAWGKEWEMRVVGVLVAIVVVSAVLYVAFAVL